MGLKQDIIVVNEFTVPLVGNSGSRGGSPGDYVLRYMARGGATESLAPIRKHRTDMFIERYMAREEATEALDVSDSMTLKRRMSKAQGVGGVAFGYGQVSLSDESLRAASKDIQSLFESGHTVMKTVLSFDEDYLRKHKIVSKDFSAQNKGDYRGHIDQMKMRLAIMNGVDRMGRTLYDDLRYIAVIQVDTLHVHCHLAMVDAGKGAKAHNGTQRGTVSARARSLVRRGIDTWLDEKQAVKHMSSAVGYERRNVTTYVKRWAHQQMLRESLPQFLLACLPEDRRQWRYATNAKNMRKPNRIVREIVLGVLEQPESPYQAAMARIQRYANYRRTNEGLNHDEWKVLVEQGRERIIERGVNGVYSLLRGLPKDTLRIKTPMLDVMGLDYEDMAARAATPQRQHKGVGAAKDADDLIGFGFRLRSYSSRLEHHITHRELAHEQARIWEKADAAGAASIESQVVHTFYLEEEAYHARTAAKYRSLLSFVPASAQWQPWVDEVASYGEQLLSLESLRKDPSLRRMKDPQEAEALGQDIYRQRGGALVSIGDKQSLGEVDRRIAAMRLTYDTRVDELRMKLSANGLRIETVPGTHPASNAELRVSAGAEFDFEDVKALDLHHMRFDFARDVEVGARGRAGFQQWAHRRQEALSDAVAYLERSGQSAAVEELPVRDIGQMMKLAATFEAGGTELPSEVSALARRRGIQRRSQTVTLGAGLEKQLQARIVDETLLLDSDQALGLGEFEAKEQATTEKH